MTCPMTWSPSTATSETPRSSLMRSRGPDQPSYLRAVVHERGAVNVTDGVAVGRGVPA